MFKILSQIKKFVLSCLFAFILYSIGVVCVHAAARNDGAGETQQPSREYTSHLLSVMNTWVTMIGVSVTVLLAGAIASEWAKTVQTERRMKDFDRRVAEQIANFQQQYKPPEAILNDARKEYDPMIKMLEGLITQRCNDLSLRASDTNGRIDKLEISLGTLRTDARADFREFEKRFSPAASIEGVLLAKVLNAFLFVGSLTDEERKSIAEILAVGTSS